MCSQPLADVASRRCRAAGRTFSWCLARCATWRHKAARTSTNRRQIAGRAGPPPRSAWDVHTSQTLVPPNKPNFPHVLGTELQTLRLWLALDLYVCITIGTLPMNERAIKRLPARFYFLVVFFGCGRHCYLYSVILSEVESCRLRMIPRSRRTPCTLISAEALPGILTVLLLSKCLYAPFSLYAAGTFARPRAVGSPKQLAARSYRARDFLR